MSDPQRRELLAAAGMASLATLAGVQPAAAGDPSFMNNVPDPALADKELPTFKFALEKSVGKVIGNSYGKEATVTHQPSAPLQGWKLPPETHKYRLLAQPPHATYRGGREWRVDSSRFPIAKTITGVVLDLDPGALRTLHWHPNADEWQYVIEGEVSVTLFGSHGRFRTEQLQKGDAGYIPQGYRHSIENLGDKPARILIGFNAGLETIDLSQWIAANSVDVLATNFGQPPELFRKFPDRDVFIAGGRGEGK